MAVKKIEPATVEQVSFGNTTDIDIPQGQAMVIPIVNGAEKPQEAFFTSIGTAERYYSNAEKYSIKKRTNHKHKIEQL